MGDYTFLRVEIGNDTVAGAIDKIPGVAAVDTLPVDEDEQPADVDSEEFDPDSRSSAAFDTDDDGSSRKEQLVGLAREWGLLGLGISMVGLGAAIAGLWFYRRRKGSDEEAADDWTATTIDAGSETPPPAAVEATGDSSPDTESESNASETVLSEPAADERSEDADTEKWVTRTELDTEDTAESAAEEVGDEETDEEPAEYDSIDAAPLVGMAFLVLLGALVKWAQGNAEDDV